MFNRVLVQPFIKPSARALREREAKRRRDPAVRAARRLYQSREWRVLRAEALRLSGWCQHPGCKARADVVDHRIPHRGVARLFFDPENLWCLCKRHHDRKTARFDGGFGRARRDETPSEVANDEPFVV